MAQTADQVANAYYQRGMAMIDKQDYDAAVKDFEAALQINEKDRARLPSAAAPAYLKLDARSRPRPTSIEAIKLAPGVASVYFERGAAFHRVDDYDNAIADSSEAIKLDPRSR